MIEIHKKGPLTEYWSDKPETMPSVIFEEGSDWDIETDILLFLEELGDKARYKKTWQKRYRKELELIEYAMNPEGPLVWHHFRDYLDIARETGLRIESRALEAAVVSESIHVAKKAAEFPLNVKQMTYLLARPEITVHDTREVGIMQINAGNSMENINRAAKLATNVRAKITA